MRELCINLNILRKDIEAHVYQIKENLNKNSKIQKNNFTRADIKFMLFLFKRLT